MLLKNITLSRWYCLLLIILMQIYSGKKKASGAERTNTWKLNATLKICARFAKESSTIKERLPA